VDEVVHEVKELVGENRVLGEVNFADFNDVSNLRFIDRFRRATLESWRRYKYLNHPRGYYPICQNLGSDGGFSKSVTYLQALFGALESFQHIVSANQSFNMVDHQNVLW